MLLVVGWDGACFELTDGPRRAGRMPVLDSLLATGHAWRVRSTTPAVTFPAWTSFLTGATPDHHGITDFTIPRSDGYGVRFANATHRALPTIVARMAEAGRRVGIYGMPATYPPEGRGVFEICGFDTPLGATSGRRAAHPAGVADWVLARHGRLGIEGLPQARIDAGWHEDARRRLLDDIALRTRIAEDLLASHELDVFVVHFMEPDTAAHHFWQFDDEASPRHRRGPRGVLADVYAALDASLGRLLEAAGPQSDVLLLSDHGSGGASDRAIFWNRWLAGRGWLAFRETPRRSAAAGVKRAALALLPTGLQARAFAAAGSLVDRVESASRFAGIDWTGTRVYSDEVPYFPGLRLNLAGREKSGVVRPGEREQVIDEVTRDLLAFRDPIDGDAVVESVRRREEVFDGPFAHRYPDLILDLRRPDGYAYGAGSSRGGAERDALRRWRAGEATGAKGSATSGVHSLFGMAVLAGPSASRATGGSSSGTQAANGAEALRECGLADLGATALALAGVAIPAAMQGRSLVQSVRPVAPLEDRGEVSTADAHASWAGGFRDYAEDEEREVAERLRALGYLP